MWESIVGHASQQFLCILPDVRHGAAGIGTVLEQYLGLD
jgi:hypothetical protein